MSEEQERPGAIHLGRGYRLIRRPGGQVRIAAERGAPPLDYSAFRALVDARLAECRDALGNERRRLLWRIEGPEVRGTWQDSAAVVAVESRPTREGAD